MQMQITTNNQWRFFTYRYDVPEDVLANQFDYLDEGESSDNFFCYRGIWYHTADFMRVPQGANEIAGWHGYSNDSMCSGVLIKLSDDGEQYQVATFCS